VDADNVLVGIVTNRDLRFEDDPDRPVTEVMTDRDRLHVAAVGTTLDEAKETFRIARIEKLPMVDDAGRLAGLITVKDLTKAVAYPHATKDGHGRLRVAAAIGVGPEAYDRAKQLVAANVDVIVVDTAHGHSTAVLTMVDRLKSDFGIEVIAGNVSTGAGAAALASAGADVVKAGQGPGTICTTRVVAGAGVPQMTAIFEAADALAGTGTRLIADGGVRFSGDLTKALAAGADAVMVGGLLAGTDEAPGEMVVVNGERWKEYRGMGSVAAMAARSGAAADRYGQAGVQADKLVPEGVEARVSVKGPVSAVLHQLVGGLRSGMGYCGAMTIPALRSAEFVQVTAAAVAESHPHDVALTRNPPNYS
jgi:IMP dehydrogenase